MAEVKKRTWRTWTRRVIGVLVALIIGLALWVYFGCFATPPTLEGRPAILDVELKVDADGTRRLGSSWFRFQKGRSLLHLEGDAFSMGYANAKLTADLLEFQERSLINTAREFFPSKVSLAGMALLIVLNNRSLSDYVSHELQLEVLGLSMGSADPFPEYGPRYNRLLNYHAAHDIAHWVADKPVVGCTAFAASGRRTSDGHLIVGRMFDFEAGAHFDENKIIGRYVPKEGRQFLTVSWPGMAGAVTGLNADGVWCSVNGAHSESRGRIGTPVSLVIRDVLQHAANLEQAVAIIRSARVFVSDSYLVADRVSGRAVVVEKTPEKCEVRDMVDGLIVQANHFESSNLAPDAGNVAYMSEGTSVERHGRITELLASATGRIDPSTSVGILRDRLGRGGVSLALGNRSAIDALIATHAVVADVTAGVMWVSRGPHGLGAFDAYSLSSFETPPAPSLGEDPLLSDGGYARVTQARELVAAAKKESTTTGRLGATTRAGLRTAILLVPGDTTSLMLEAEAMEVDGDTAAAMKLWREALAGRPAFRDDRVRIEAEIKRLEGKGVR